MSLAEDPLADDDLTKPAAPGEEATEPGASVDDPPEGVGDPTTDGKRSISIQIRKTRDESRPLPVKDVTIEPEVPAVHQHVGRDQERAAVDRTEDGTVVADAERQPMVAAPRRPRGRIMVSVVISGMADLGVTAVP